MMNDTVRVFALSMTLVLAAACGTPPSDGAKDAADAKDGKVGDTTASAKEGPGGEADLKCTVDEDCVPAQCCHPSTCVAKSSAPNCEDMMCTMDCKGGTMDCGAGRCVCNEGTCTAQIDSPRIIAPPGAVPE